MSTFFGDTGKIFCYWHKMGSTVPPRDTISNLLTPATTTNMNAWKGNGPDDERQTIH